MCFFYEPLFSEYSLQIVALPAAVYGHVDLTSAQFITRPNGQLWQWHDLGFSSYLLRFTITSLSRSLAERFALSFENRHIRKKFASRLVASLSFTSYHSNASLDLVHTQFPACIHNSIHKRTLSMEHFLYSGTPLYGHPVNTVTFFWPGKTAIHFLIKKTR